MDNPYRVRTGKKLQIMPKASLDYKMRLNNTKIIASALLKGEAKYEGKEIVLVKGK